MKKGAKPILKPTRFKYIFFVVCLLSISTLLGQETNEQAQDSTKTGVELGRLILENPDSIVAKYTYDPKTNTYVYTESVGDFNVNYPVILTPEQYYDLVEKEQMKAYFKQKADAYSGKRREVMKHVKICCPISMSTITFLRPFLEETLLR